MGTVTVNESRTRNITIDGVTPEQIDKWIEDGIKADFGADLPADFELDADDTLRFFDPGAAGTPTIWQRGQGGVYRFVINETD